MRRPIHGLFYGESGSGKSSLARTFPKPMLVFGFDPITQLEPYLEMGTAVIAADGSSAEVFSRKTGDLLIRIECYTDPTDESKMRSDSAYIRFKRRVKGFGAEFAAWNTVVFDSVSAMSMAFRKYDEYVANANAKDRRQWYGAATFEVEDFVMWKLNGWPMNVVVICHTDYDKAQGDSGVLRYKPKMPGQSLGDVPRVFSEFYHTFVRQNDEGVNEYWVQTQTAGLFPAASRIHAPNPCRPHYRELWANQPPETPEREAEVAVQAPEQEPAGDLQPDSEDGDFGAAILAQGSSDSATSRGTGVRPAVHRMANGSGK